MNFQRKQKIPDYQEKGRVLMIYGPRRVGKTTLLKEYLSQLPVGIKAKYDVGDDMALRQLFNAQVRKDILDYAKPYDVIGIDEAQQIASIGIGIKMIIDEFPDKKIILTGSSSFDLSQSVGEPLTGRHYVLQMYPLAWSELAGSEYERKQNLNEILLYGSYPEVLSADDHHKKQQKLKELVSSYLFKDILAFERLKSPGLLLKILQALAWQIGGDVSQSELARLTGEGDHKKIGRYLDLLEKSFVIKKVGAWNTNLRNEIKNPVKYYFYDLGIRNAVIGQFQDISQREGKDIGMLWENFVFIELLKKSVIEEGYFDEFYFWRNVQQKEIDIIKKESDGTLMAYECKWSPRKAFFGDFKKAYPHAETIVISRENFSDFL